LPGFVARSSRTGGGEDVQGVAQGLQSLLKIEHLGVQLRRLLVVKGVNGVGNRNLDFIDEVEVSITDAVDALDDAESARLYSEVLDVEQRLEALRDALDVLAGARP
jgi:hypothetical protein